MPQLNRVRKLQTGCLFIAGKLFIPLVFLCLSLVILPAPSHAEESDRQDGTQQENLTFSELRDYLVQKINEAPQQPWRKTADQVLFPENQVRWTRYLHSVAQLPDWVDAGVAFRVRANVMTNPFRKGEFGTTEQLPVRTRARLGLNGEIFRFLFEFQDSRAFDADEGELISNAIFNETAIQQLFVSATF